MKIETDLNEICGQLCCGQLYDEVGCIDCIVKPICDKNADEWKIPPWDLKLKIEVIE